MIYEGERRLSDNGVRRSDEDRCVHADSKRKDHRLPVLPSMVENQSLGPPEWMSAREKGRHVDKGMGS